MNKNKFFLVALLCMLLQSVTCLADDKIIPVEQLPASAKTFVKKYFPQATIEYATKDTEFMGATYEVRLSDGTEVDFDKKGNWDNVDKATGIMWIARQRLFLLHSFLQLSLSM